jgi:hypothetical protein
VQAQDFSGSKADLGQVLQGAQSQSSSNLNDRLQTAVAICDLPAPNRALQLAPADAFATVAG